MMCVGGWWRSRGRARGRVGGFSSYCASTLRDLRGGKGRSTVWWLWGSLI